MPENSFLPITITSPPNLARLLKPKQSNISPPDSFNQPTNTWSDPETNKTINGNCFPAFMSIEEVFQASQARPPVLIDGMLHKGSKMVLGGGSKSYKTFCLIDLGLAVATGKEWWGHRCHQTDVLFINFEIQTPFFGDRVKAVMEAKIIDSAPGFAIWNLRGVCYDLSQIIPELRQRIASKEFGLIILDPLYKCLGGLDENKAGDMAQMLNGVERITHETGAAVVFGSHFAKGNAANKESLDRISGSGVFARDPDAILTMTRQEDADCFSIEATVRNFAPITPFVVEWQYPAMRIRTDKDAARLLRSRRNDRKYTSDQLLTCLPAGGLKSGEWEQASGMAHGTFDALRRALVSGCKVKQEGGLYFRVEQPIHHATAK